MADGQQAQWSDYAKPGPYTTTLAPDQEQQFRQWVTVNKIPWQDSPTSDYDMRGYWQAQQAGDPNAKRAANLHFPDTWKTPYHQTFSNESKYALPTAGHWEGQRFIAPRKMAEELAQPLPLPPDMTATPPLPTTMPSPDQVQAQTAEAQPAAIPPPRQPGTSGLAQQAPSRGDIFRNMLGEFLYSAGKGLAAAGHGPEANARGAGAAITAIPELSMMQHQQAIAAQNAASLAGLREAQSQKYQPATWVDEAGTPHQMTAEEFARLKAGQLRAQATVTGSENRVAGAETVQAMKGQQAQALQGQKGEQALAQIAAKGPKEPTDPLYQITKQLNPGLDPKSPEFATAWEKTRMMEKTVPRIQGMNILLQRNYHPVNDAGGATIGWFNPSTGQTISNAQVPGLAKLTEGGAIPAKPSGQTISRADAGAAIVPLIDRARQLIADPEVAKTLGVLPGRVSEVEKKLGDLPPKTAELYGTLKSIYSLGGTMHGWRAIEVANEFEKAYGGLHTNPSSLLGGLAAMQATANAVAGRVGGRGAGTPATDMRTQKTGVIKYDTSGNRIP